MERPRPSLDRRRLPRFSPRCEGLEARLALAVNAVGNAALSFTPTTTSDAASEVDVSVYPLRYQKFSARFQGGYLTSPARLDGFSTMLYMNGGGMSSMFLHGNIQVGYYVPTDTTKSVVGRVLILPKSAIQSGSQMVLDLHSIPGKVDKAGRPTEFTWTLNKDSAAQYSSSDGSGTLQLIYTPSTRGRRGGGSGNLGVIISGQVGLTGVDDPLRGK
ncbi:hypothetical protein [Paludisphaera rhizosphaerae]|uniref:hypothetical protein n=1 Tax=Paludisphaera rhizosphaerae TaxID=2711216 RepID=UPI0013EC88D8|nr:hypothetical protein [Paludisphaera rhizosphaerae]